ncbi:MAG TPA: FAD-dependent monooxygenase [Xanthobacteraceae bacterium]|nr:FAD-dependent monooxygenase [Xanthobacteraceae bacterium]
MAANKSVVVVGAGPVGLCLALALAQSEIAVTLVEAMSDESFLDQVPRAGSNHPSTLEYFDKIGLYERMLPRGIVAPKFQYWDRQDGSVIAEFDHVHLENDTKFPFVLQCERIKIIEEALKMARQNPLISVRMATTFTGLSQSADDVTVHVVDRDGEADAITAGYLASAEGARSVARKQMDVEFEGFTYPERTLNIEVAYDFTKHGFTERNYISDPVEYSNLFHWKGPPDRWRIHFPTDPNEDEAALTRPEALQARLKSFLPIDGDYRICGWNLYAVHQRVAKTFRVGRAILLGDAAHVNSPIGGMGLNSGVHDAFNLADKLARILHGVAHDSELDRYDRQRRQIAIKHTQAQTMRNKRLLEERDPAIRKRNHDELRRTADDPVLARKFLLRAALFDSLREAEQIQ